MHGQGDGAPPSAEAIADGFEHKDVRTASVGIAMAIGATTIALSIVGLFVMLGAAHREDREGPPLTAQQAAVIQPPGPPLQSNPLDEIVAFRKHEADEAAAYRWLSADHVAARIPIARAMALVVGKPLDLPRGTAP